MHGKIQMNDPSIEHKAPPGYVIRPATLDEVEDLTRLWFMSFNSSHDFWKITTPEDKVTTQWFNDVWAMGIRAGPEIIATWVVEDLNQGGKAVGFSRWHVPQLDRSQEIPFPPFLKEWDPELVDAFWGGMACSIHWMSEFGGVDPACQRSGILTALLIWGCDEADAAGLENYLDATPQGRRIYLKFGFEDREPLPMLERPDSYGTFKLTAQVRLPKPFLACDANKW
ncbi:hypothetical protein H072_11467 [Dactylellina haptotyla CBS 200.50]|uniref:N-acetyltransferase domain-containing protein n=1 Tax=Dactylellina haptotyla (strain CBS 200.50) TaxID=1284197 RepID=S7ZWK8_DACHA|nr:hypothetical protein H072_11467 [Dactylellina haptotyla CBS 200.50]